MKNKKLILAISILLLVLTSTITILILNEQNELRKTENNLEESKPILHTEYFPEDFVLPSRHSCSK